jgi:hypothetical protein
MTEHGSSKDAASILRAAVALTPMIHAGREDIECRRRLPLTMPRAWGGVELDPVSQLRIVEALAAADASGAGASRKSLGTQR